MPTDLVVVDAFTDRPFSGNPAAVCLLRAAASERWMQQVAAQMNLSETAFVVVRPDGDHDLRWFTPTIEADLCGHATLATASVLGGGRFHTRSGLLTCTVEPDGTVSMDFPSDPPVPVPAPAGLIEALRADQAEVIEVLSGTATMTVVLGSAADVRSLRPDIELLAAIEKLMIVVTAAGDRSGVDCVSRVFCPRAGIPEDPVTGSAHCTLAPWWSEQLDRPRLVGEQASSRGGTVTMEFRGDRTTIGGRARRAAEVRLHVDPT